MTTSSRFEIISTLAARAFAMIGPFGVSILTARLLGPEDRGRYFFIIALAQIAAQLAGLGLHASNSYLVAARRHLLGRLVINSLVVALLLGPLAALLVIGVALWPELMGHGDVQPTGPAAFMALLIAPLSLSVLYLTNIAVGVGRVQLFNGLTVLSGVLALLAAGLVAASGGGLPAYLAAAAAALAVTATVGLGCLLRGNVPDITFDVPLFREGIAYAFRAYLAAVLGFLLLRVGVIALQYNASFADLGQFSVAAQISDALVLVPSTVGLLLFPNLIRADPNDRWRATVTTLRGVSLFMIALSLLISAILPYVMPLIFGRAYDAAIWLTIALLPSVLLVSLQSVLSQFVAAEGFPWGQVRAWLIGFLTATFLSFALSGPYTSYGVVVALTVSNLVVFLLLLREARILQMRRSMEKITV
jgi:O-antigen/teichoic acid export membrane protein